MPIMLPARTQSSCPRCVHRRQPPASAIDIIHRDRAGANRARRGRVGRADRIHAELNRAVVQLNAARERVLCRKGRRSAGAASTGRPLEIASARNHAGKRLSRARCVERGEFGCAASRAGWHIKWSRHVKPTAKEPHPVLSGRRVIVTQRQHAPPEEVTGLLLVKSKLGVAAVAVVVIALLAVTLIGFVKSTVPQPRGIQCPPLRMTVLFPVPTTPVCADLEPAGVYRDIACKLVAAFATMPVNGKCAGAVFHHIASIRQSHEGRQTRYWFVVPLIVNVPPAGSSSKYR